MLAKPYTRVWLILSQTSILRNKRFLNLVSQQSLDWTTISCDLAQVSRLLPFPPSCVRVRCERSSTTWLRHSSWLSSMFVLRLYLITLRCRLYLTLGRGVNQCDVECVYDLDLCGSVDLMGHRVQVDVPVPRNRRYGWTSMWVTWDGGHC